MSDVTAPGGDVPRPGEEVPGSVDRTGAHRASMYDIDTRSDVHQLHRGAIGLWGVLFLTVTGAAPISAMLFNTPISVGFGNGIGTPAGFAFATIILTIFSVGYVEMSRRVTAAGGFYSFISHGLGRELGMASGISAFLAYCVFEASLAGGWARSIMSYLIITGAFACGMAFHNTAARYFYSLGREGIAPRGLGRTHARWKSPHIASLTQSGLAALIVALFALFASTTEGGHAPTEEAYIQLYGLMAVMGVIIILAIQALVSAAILVYFWRRGEHNWVKTVLCPLIAVVAQVIVLYLLLKNIEFLGAGYGLANWLVWIDLAVFLLGIAAALILKRRNPERYDTIGRLVYEGV